MRLVAFSTITIIFIALILPAILSFGVIYIPQNDQPPLDKTQKIYENLAVSQSFISKTANLSTIGVSLKNPNLANKKDIVLSIYENNILLRSSVLNGKQIADGKFVKFKFEPVVDSQNKQFLFTLRAPSTSEEEANKNEVLEVFLSDQILEGASDLKIGNREVLTSIVSFVSFSKPPYPTYVLESIYSKWFSKLMTDWQFFTAYTFSILILASLLLSKKLAKFLPRH